MRLFRQCWLLAILPLLSGCITSLTMDSANTRTFKTLPDAVDRIEKASITRNNGFSILVGARLTNALDRQGPIEQAKGIVAERSHIGVDDAFARVRGFARAHNRLLSETARQIIDGSLDVETLNETVRATPSRPKP